MGIIDLSSFTSKQGLTTAVWLYDEADTLVVQHEFLHISFYKEDFKDFVDTLLAALRKIERTENPLIRHIHPIVIRESGLDLSVSEDLSDVAPDAN